MKPAITLFHKEFRQHGAFALAMVIMCLLFQIATYESSRWFGNPVSPGIYFFIALVLTALYAGAAAALAYSTEHADNTYTFLRKLPISTTTLALGKIGWVLCGTILVLLCNCLLAAVWSGGILDGQIATAFGVSILEMFVWGLFWSTRCRSQVHAMLAGFACASLSAWLIANMFAPVNSDTINFYLAVVPYRLALIAVMACFAFWGALRWFEFDVTRDDIRAATGRSRLGRLIRNLPVAALIRYPQKIQSPFLALVHQHIRHTSLLYPLGIAAFVVFSLGCLYLCCFQLVYGEVATLPPHTWWWFGMGILMGSMLLFWGNIFGHDQKNDSYRFLSRLGIHEGKIWWSRMLPALLLYVSVIVCFLAYFVVDYIINDWTGGSRGGSGNWKEMFEFTSRFLAIWLAPVAMGAFFSISFRSQMVAIALTIGGTLALLGWMMIFVTLFGSSPLWTTVPIALALLIASRLRAKYWLRETYSWRSRLIPLVPFFVVMLAIPVALPFVRIYSIPYVSWEQIDTYFDQADLQAKRNPVKRKALLQYIAAHGTLPEEYEAMLDDISAWNRPIPAGLTYEEYLLLEYALSRCVLDALRTGQIPESMMKFPLETHPFYRFRYLPWEQARIARALRVRLAAQIVSGGHFDRRAVALRNFYESVNLVYSPAVFDQMMWDPVYYTDLHIGWRWCERPLHYAIEAIAKWYKEHGTFPESLDELEGTFVHPFTDEPVRYYVDSPPPEDMNIVLPNASGIRQRYNITFYKIGGDYIRADSETQAAFQQHGGTYLVLRNRIYVLIEPDTEPDSEPRPVGRDHDD